MSNFASGHEIFIIYGCHLSERKFGTLTSRKMLKRYFGSVYTKFERNYQTFNKIQASRSFGRHVGEQNNSYTYHFVEKVKLP